MSTTNTAMVDHDPADGPTVAFVLDGRLHVFDAMVFTSGRGRIDPRPWLGRPMVELVAASDRERVGAALRDASGPAGVSAQLDVELELQADEVAVRLRISPGSRFVHVAVEPKPVAPSPTLAQPPEESETEPSNRLEYIGMVASRISHDFKNLLAAILVNAEFLSRESDDPALVVEVSDEIIVATERARELIEQILGHAGAKGDATVLVDLNELTHEMGRLLDVSTPPTVVMRFDLGEEIPQVRGRPARLRQLVMNFIVNAAEAIGEEVGAIMLTTRLVEADRDLLVRSRTRAVPGPGRFVCLSIEDTGPGLDEQTARKIFDPFFTTKKTGHGLGLSASLTIVEEHGGALLLEPTPGHGATFRVLLPAVVVDERPSLGMVKTASSREFRGHTVLVIDDDELLRSSTSRTLTARGVDVLSARDGLEGIDVFSEEHARISCVLLDMGMPYIKGSDVFDELRGIDSRVPIVFVSGHAEEELYEHQSVRDADGLLLKPFRDEQLVDTLARVLDAPPRR